MAMCGFGLKTGWSWTPTKTGTLYIWIHGRVSNASSLDGVQVQGRYGTGTAPSPNALATGTGFGLPQNYLAPAGGQQPFGGFVCAARIAGLTLSTPIWIDIAIASLVGGLAEVQDVDCMILEAY
jgi:hypothetical protein